MHDPPGGRGVSGVSKSHEWGVSRRWSPTCRVASHAAVMGDGPSLSRTALFLRVLLFLLLSACCMTKFALGDIYVAPEARQKLTELGRTVEEFLRRHEEADWGDNAKIQKTSSYALARNSRAWPLMSFYRLMEHGGIVIATNPSQTHTAVSWRKLPAAPKRKKSTQDLSDQSTAALRGGRQ